MHFHRLSPRCVRVLCVEGQALGMNLTMKLIGEGYRSLKRKKAAGWQPDDF